MHNRPWLHMKGAGVRHFPWEPRRRIYDIITIGLMVAGAALLYNISYQSAVYRKALASRANIAAFVNRDAVSKVEEVRQQIKVLPGIKNLYLVTPEEALASALRDTPELNEVMVTGDNPFSPYFLVYPQPATPAQSDRLKEEIRKLADIEDVRADDRLFVMIEILDALGSVYRTGLLVIGSGFVMVIIVQRVKKSVRAPVSFRHIAAAGAAGLAGGALGMGLTALLMHTAPVGLAPLPVAALLLCIPAGIVLGLHEN